MISQSVDVADKSAVFLSFLCMLHCVLTPFLTLIIPYVAIVSVLEQEATHIWLLVFVIPISLFAIIRGYQKHGHFLTLLLAIVGLLLLVVAATVGHDIFGHVGEVAATLIGSIFLVVSHIKNMQQRKSLTREEFKIETEATR